MASIENRSRTLVSVKNFPEFSRYFPFNKVDEAGAYVRRLKGHGHNPKVSVLDEAYLVRFRVNGKRKAFTAASEGEALAVQKRIEADQHQGLFVDYTKAHQTTFAELLLRYLKEVAPRKKGFLVLGYQINTWLQDAGYKRQDLAAIHAAHPNPQNPKLRIPKAAGRRISQPSEAVAFIRKGFAAVAPEDFTEYIDERLQTASPATVDRELDVFRAVCNTAMNVWRIHIPLSPMAGLERPKYFNERDRRLRPHEEERLMEAADHEDRRWAERELGRQMTSEREGPSTKYQHLKTLALAREMVASEGNTVPMFSAFIQFQLMTGARRGETLNLQWKHVDLQQQTAFLPETKNGIARSLPLRSDLVAWLLMLPRSGDNVFPIPPEYLRKAWTRMCEAAGIATSGDERLRIHDLRHEAISRVAEAGSQTPGGFSLLDLQAFSGHRDPRMLLRYTHLTPSGLAKRLDVAFSQAGLDAGVATTHHGRRRLTKAAHQPLASLLTTPLCGGSEKDPQEPIEDEVLPTAPGLPSNVIQFPRPR